MKGTVKFFNAGKGFGFIAGEDGKEYFVHQTGLTEGTNINENDEVTFDVEEGDRGPKAANVSLATAEEAPVEETEEKAA
ncbi:cold-shock protein [Nanoarchaeota archaeon]